MTFAGLDFGTSGARLVVIDAQNNPVFGAKTTYDLPDRLSWEAALGNLLCQIPITWRRCLMAIVIDGTSGTFLVCDPIGNPQTVPQLYSDDRGRQVLPLLQAFCPPEHLVLSSTSTLARWYRLWHQQKIQTPSLLMHQADWLGYRLHGQLGITDFHNVLKLGFDPEQGNYPDWLENFLDYFPKVIAPGTPIGPILPNLAQDWQINPTCLISAGTTDSNAAFLAAVGNDFQPGVAMTSLGSTLVLKTVSRHPIGDRASGVYSHRWDLPTGRLWLAGGASNTGGAVLRHFFTDQELATFSQEINTDRPSPFSYYPLLQPGERFPICNPDQLPLLTPRPPTPAQFLHGLLESMSRIEAQGYDRLQELGADPITRLYTVGGGSHNPVWHHLRQRYLPVPFAPPHQGEAAFGAALLAHHGWISHAHPPQS